MAVTREQAMAEAAKSLHTADIHASDPRRALHHREVAGHWIDLAGLANDDVGRVDGYIQAMALVRDLAAVDRTEGLFDVFIARARAVQAIFDGTPLGGTP